MFLHSWTRSALIETSCDCVSRCFGPPATRAGTDESSERVGPDRKGTFELAPRGGVLSDAGSNAPCGGDQRGRTGACQRSRSSNPRRPGAHRRQPAGGRTSQSAALDTASRARFNPPRDGSPVAGGDNGPLPVRHPRSPTFACGPGERPRSHRPLSRGGSGHQGAAVWDPTPVLTIPRRRPKMRSCSRRRAPSLRRRKNLRSWGCSSVGRAPRSQRGGHRFDPGHLHQLYPAAGCRARRGPRAVRADGPGPARPELVNPVRTGR